VFRERITARESLKHPFLVNTLGLNRRQSLASIEHKEGGLHSPTHHGQMNGHGNNGVSNHYPGFATPPITPSQPITPVASVDSAHPPINNHTPHGTPAGGTSPPSNATLSLAEAGLEMFK
jgi:hypothetical protein